MALPIPNSNNRRPEKNKAPEAEVQSLPTPEDFVLPNLSVPSAPLPEPTPEPPAALVENQRAPQKEGWAVDAHTGVKYKTLAANNPEAIKAFKSEGGKGLTLDQLRRYSKTEEDFDIDNLNNTADAFLAHLRVPVPQEEIDAARRARAARLNTDVE